MNQDCSLYFLFQEPGLTKATFTAFIQTLNALDGLVSYLIGSIGFKYVLLGRIQSDNLERRFGWYRQLHGGNYLISMKQLLLSEKKIRTISLLKYSNVSLAELGSISHHDDDRPEIRSIADQITAQLLMNISPSEKDHVIICYVSGACARSVIRSNKCGACRCCLVNEEERLEIEFDDSDSNIKSFFANVDRGGLFLPHHHIFQLGLYSWKVFQEIRNTSFLINLLVTSPYPSQIFSAIIEELFACDFFDIYVGQNRCTAGHDVISAMTQRLYNCLLKNFVKSISEKQVDKRKSSKLSSSTNF